MDQKNSDVNPNAHTLDHFVAAICSRLLHTWSNRHHFDPRSLFRPFSLGPLTHARDSFNRFLYGSLLCPDSLCAHVLIETNSSMNESLCHFTSFSSTLRIPF